VLKCGVAERASSPNYQDHGGSQNLICQSRTGNGRLYKQSAERERFFDPPRRPSSAEAGCNQDLHAMLLRDAQPLKFISWIMLLGIRIHKVAFACSSLGALVHLGQEDLEHGPWQIHTLHDRLHRHDFIERLLLVVLIQGL